MDKKYYLDDYISERLIHRRNLNETKVVNTNSSKILRFTKLCGDIKNSFQVELDGVDTKEQGLEILSIQRKAILGEPKAVEFYKERVQEYLRRNSMTDEWYPTWYKNLVDAVFHENWGLAGIAPWVGNYKDEYAKSISAKIIGENIFFMINGVMQLQPQKISTERLQQLRSNLILGDPTKKTTDAFCDVFLRDGTRVTLFGDDLTKGGRETIVFRKFIIEDVTLDEQARLGTIPDYSVEAFELFTRLGYNVIISGGPNTGKSTFYKTLQKYEDPTLQGIQIETDPEVDMAKIMPGSPIMELLADGEDLRKIMKPILRGDPDYIKIGEARDGYALHVGVRAANKGTRRVKITYHNTNSITICNQIAEEIVEAVGGSLQSTTEKVARSFNYVFDLFYLNNSKTKKRLKGIYEITYDEVTHEIIINQICKYNIRTSNWEWSYHFGEDKKDIGMLESIEGVDRLDHLLKKFADEYPLSGDTEFRPRFLG